MTVYLYSVRSPSLVCAFIHTVVHEDGLAPSRRRGPSLALGEPDSTTWQRRNRSSPRPDLASRCTLRYASDFAPQNPKLCASNFFDTFRQHRQGGGGRQTVVGLIARKASDVHLAT